MKHRFQVQVIRNSTGEVVQTSDFATRQEAETYISVAGPEYGPDKKENIVFHYDEEAALREDEISDRSEARYFCLYIIDSIAAYNQKCKTQQEVQAIFSQPAMGAITLALLTGGIKTARAMIAAVGPSLYPEAFVSRVLQEMDIWISVNEPPPESQDETPSQGENPPEGESSSDPV